MNDSSAERPSGTAQTPTATPKTNGFVRFFWLGERIAEAKQLGFNANKPGWVEFKLAQLLEKALEQLKEVSEASYSALVLARSELQLLLRCYLLRHDLGVSSRPISEEDFTHLQEIPLINQIWSDLPRSHEDRLHSCVGPDAEISLGDLDALQRTQLLGALREIASKLLKPLEQEASRVGKLVSLRWLRISIVLALVIAALSALFGGSSNRPGTENLALHRPVTTSSQIPGLGTDHALLVDGDKTNLGFHTDNGPNQFVVIDLGSTKKFDQVVVYNRADCCKERAIPVRLEVSSDGVNYKTLADRKDTFDVWTATNLGAKGRYVRLRLLESNPFHLAEVEIY